MISGGAVEIRISLRTLDPAKVVLMNYNAQVRRILKKECKERVKAQFGRCVGIQFLYIIPSVLITLILYISVFGKALNMVLAGSSDEAAIASVLAEGMNSNAVWIVALMMLLVTGPLTYGLMQFYIGLGRGEEPGVGTLFKAFTSLSSLWTGIKMEFCLSFRSMVWMMIPSFVASTAGALLSTFFGGPSAEMLSVSMAIAYVLYFIIQIPVRVKLKEYEAGWVLENDREGLGVWEATRAGGWAFFGRFGKLLWFMFSFMGWYILEFVLIGICVIFAAYGLIVMGNVIGIAAAVLALTALVCIALGFSSFLSAYLNTSFFALYELFTTLPNKFRFAENGDFTEDDNDSWDGTGL